jgi:hypothetical protein
MSDRFVDAAGGDAHLDTANAGALIDAGACVLGAPVDDDFDGDLRDANPDVGADEI